MAMSDKFSETVDKISYKTGELAGKAKKKLDEKFTDEKKVEYREKIDGFFESADKELTRIGENIETGFKSAFDKKEDK